MSAEDKTVSPVEQLVTRNRSAVGLPRVRVAHSGRQYVYQHALSVERCGVLDRFITSSYYKPDVFPDRWLAGLHGIDRVLRLRFQEGLPSDKIVRRWRYELPELLARRAFGSGRMSDGCMFHRDARFDRWVARRWIRDCDVYWGFQGSCLESLRAARKTGITAVAEFSTAHVTMAIDVLSQEAKRHPEWASTISNFHFPDWYRERLEQEPHAADVCIVASAYTRCSLEAVGIDSDQIQHLPLGADLGQFRFVRRSAEGPFRILFVGGVGQRKGVKYLLQAFDRMRGAGVELTIAGPLPADMRPLTPYQNRVRLTGRLDPVDIVREMHQAHVLVLPSVFEGFGLVIPEAMATGMPVIASTHSAGPEIIREGQDGFVLEPDDVEGLAEKLELLRADRQRAVEMGVQAAERAREFSWEAHSERVRQILELLATQRNANNHETHERVLNHGSH
jgi:glycosyltransferase involved in cell wall biosynthesis